MKKHTIEINKEKCIGCRMCERDCPTYNIAIENKKAVIKTQSCIMCGHCVAVCPKSAVSMTGFDEPPMEIQNPTILDPVQLMEAIRTRRSIRQYKDKAIDHDIIAQVIEAGRLTPSGGNAQDVSYIVLRDGIDRYEQIAVRLAKRLLPLVKLVSPTAKNAFIDEHFFFKKAPVAILVLSKDEMNGSLAASNMELMAEAHGLGVLYSGFFAKMVNTSGSLRRSLGITNTRAVTALVMGYPNVKYSRTVQKDAASVRYV